LKNVKIIYFMIVVLQKKSKVLIVCLLINGFFASAQTDNCSSTIYKSEQKYVPSTICIPDHSLYIAYIYSKDQAIDFNRDGINDFVCAVRKKNIIVGDKTVLLFYSMNKDSIFTLVRKFDNIIPVYFNQDDEHPKFSDKNLDDIFNCYTMPDPLYSIEIKGSQVVLDKKLDAQVTEKMRYFYDFDTSLSNWVLVAKKIYNDTESRTVKIEKFNVLSEFSFCEE
jgi:hypothetical protein